MKNTFPFVSTIIPVYNGERFLTEAVESVIKQNYSPMEIVVVDDGSTDDTEGIAMSFGRKIRYIQQKNSGPAAARNHGIKLACGEVIAFLDADDLWARTKLKTQIAYLDANPKIDLVQGMIQKMHWVGCDTGGRARFQAVGTPYYFINIGSAVYRAEVFDSVGLFDENLWENEDTDWFFRAWELNIRKAVLDEVGLYYRIHNTNLILSQKLVFHGIPKLFKAHLDRVRNQGPLPIHHHRLSDLSSYIGWRQDKSNIVAVR